MRFLFRLSFWLLLALLVVPIGRDDHVARLEPIGTMQALDAARGAIDDISAICERKPDICAAGQQVLHAIGERARDGARIAYETLDRKFGETDDPMPTGSIPAAK